MNVETRVFPGGHGVSAEEEERAVVQWWLGGAG
jgi:hypothetical protein